MMEFPRLDTTKLAVSNTVKDCAHLVKSCYDMFDNSTPLPTRYKQLATLRAKPLLLSEEMFGFVVLDNDTLFNYVVFRGTRTGKDWIADFMFDQVDHLWGKVARGFNHIYTQTSDSIKDTLKGAKSSNFVVTGHSLGAALATLAAADLAISGFQGVQMIHFAGPRVGDPMFARNFNTQVPYASRIINTEDIVPTTPPPVGEFTYSHVGVSLEFTNNLGDVKLNHSMDTYLKAITWDSPVNP